MRLTPTEAYFQSYYHQIDAASSASEFTPKSLQEKRWAIVTDPFDPSVDPAPPSHIPPPELDSDGNVKDLVKEAFASIYETGDLSLTADTFEVTGALLRLKLLRPPLHAGAGESQSFITQMTYISSFSQDASMEKLLCPPRADDIGHLLYLEGRDKKSGEPSLSLPESITVTKVRPKGTFFKPTFDMFQDGARFPVHLHRSAAGITYIELAQKAENTATKKEGGWLLDTGEMVDKNVPVITSPYYELTAKPCTGGAQFTGKILGNVITGFLPWQKLEVLEANGAPFSLEDNNATPVYLPKNFRESSVCIGDTGYLAYGTTGSSGAQEQRLQIVVKGFYDPGVLNVGARCILMTKEALRDIVLANDSYALDPEMTSGIQIWYDDLKKTPQIATKIQNELEKRGIDKYFHLTTYRDYSFAKDLLQQFQSDKTLFTLLGMIILIVACSNIISFLVLLVNDKKREIGILMAMGASRRSIGAIFATCGVVIGSIGCILGTLTAIITLRNIDPLVSLLSKIQGHDMFNAVFYGSSLQSEVSHGALLFVLIITPIISLLAGLVPAWKASRLKPTTLLRAES